MSFLRAPVTLDPDHSTDNSEFPDPRLQVLSPLRKFTVQLRLLAHSSSASFSKLIRPTVPTQPSFPDQLHWSTNYIDIKIPDSTLEVPFCKDPDQARENISMKSDPNWFRWYPTSILLISIAFGLPLQLVPSIPEISSSFCKVCSLEEAPKTVPGLCTLSTPILKD
ncbi:hypothetical protein NP233_g11867 [Leucocoprinus birnbaumii]|uniref:Uncharacterized protein n=1 Tax=Leucocoprinus birnbaumii TaxID=56174 RepID=A0AAD5VFJ7_9AGAR|nr:hypothetical protein NP233_g11867 [Leucocoprinus birnbaumii]